MRNYLLKDSAIIIYPNGKFTVCDKKELEAVSQKQPSNRANFEINISGSSRLTLGEDQIVYKGLNETEDGLELNYEYNKEHLQITTELKLIGETNVIVQKNKIKNIGDSTVKLTRFSSAFFEDIAYSEDMPWYKNQDIKVSICHSKWQGEGQWKKYTLPELGIYPTTIHDSERESFKINSVGSWSTANFYPLVIIEDNKKKNTWFMETEGSHNWYIKLASYGGYAVPSLSLEACGCDDANGGWYYDLKPNEEYSSERAFFGMTSGKFEDAVADLLVFKRADSTVRFNDGIMPIVFNDYMDCIWGIQDPKLILPLVDKAAEVGCEVFCIDGGWCENEGGKSGLGDWVPKAKFYDMDGLKEIADYIKSKNMVPGIWTELEACNSSAYGYRMNEDSVLKRYDTPIGGWRGFYNFSNPEVREYLTGKVEALYNIGFRFIKNDYNASIGIGATNNYDGESPAEGAIVNANTFYDFVDSLYEKFPELVIENCGSGALRCDNKMLRRCSLQSTSDQEFYYNNPSIVMGSMAVMPPEKAGIWSYPYPAMYPYADGKYVPFSPDDEYYDRMKDGKETVFNMVTAMTGYLYLSGRIEYCDEKNFALVKEAVDFYKNIRKYISVSRPIYPLGMLGINEEKTAALGLISDDRLLLAVWNITGKEETVTVPLSDYLKSESKINAVYPSNAECGINASSVTVKLGAKEATYIEINL